MLLLNGKKMSKSDGNSIMPNELFTGNSTHVSKGYSPMVVRFFMLQSHYRSTLDLTDEALQAAEKGYRRLMEGIATLNGLQAKDNAPAGALDAEITTLIDGVHEEMSDDFNTPKALAKLFELVSKINGLKDGHLAMEELSGATLERLKSTFQDFVFTIFGLLDESTAASDDQFATMDGLMQLVIEMRSDARTRKDWGAADKIRDTLKAVGIVLKDGKEGTAWVKE